MERKSTVNSLQQKKSEYLKIKWINSWKEERMLLRMYHRITPKKNFGAHKTVL